MSVFGLQQPIQNLGQPSLLGGFSPGFNQGLAPGWAETLGNRQYVGRPYDPREPYSLFNYNATIRDNSQFYLYGAPNEFQALFALQNPNEYWQVFDQPPNAAYYQRPPSWINSLNQQLPGIGPQQQALGQRLNYTV